MRGSPFFVLVGLMLGGDALAAKGADDPASGAQATADGGGRSSDDQAKKPAKKKGKKGKGPKNGIQVTGIESFDKVFREVGDIDERLWSAENELRTGRQNLNAALGLAQGTPFTDALADLQTQAEGKLRLGMSKGAVPKLEATDAIPANVQAAVDGFNGFTTNLTTTLSNVNGLSSDITRLVDATSAMPQNLIKEFSKGDGGVSIIEKLFVLPKAVKATTHNIEVVTGLDDRVTSLSNRMTDLVSLVHSSFQPADKGGQRQGGGQGGGGKAGAGKGGKPSGGGGKGGKGGGKGGRSGSTAGGRPIPGR
jgi:hypothetical protein